MTPRQQPWVGAVVHHVEPAVPGGVLECHAAIVTGVLADDGLLAYTAFGDAAATGHVGQLPEHVGSGCGRRPCGYPDDTWHWPVVPDRPSTTKG